MKGFILRPRSGDERGHFKNDWLESYHSFSFADYFDQKHMQFHDLRVINQDFVESGQGFATHSHRDMEILTYVYAGAITHEDSMGNHVTIPAGDVQVMSAGRGIRHSEHNLSPHELLRLLQIWILPEAKGLEPRYDQKSFSLASKKNNLCLIASRNGRSGSLVICQDCDIYASVLEAGKLVATSLRPSRALWLQLIAGGLKVTAGGLEAAEGGLKAPPPDRSEMELHAGDGLAVECFSGPIAPPLQNLSKAVAWPNLDEPHELQILATLDAEFLLFDLVDRHN